MAYDTRTLPPNSCGPNGGWSIAGPQWVVLLTFQKLDTSMKDWYQYQPWILTHREQLRETRHLTHNTMALMPNSSGPMVDGPFLDPKGVLCILPILDASMKDWHEYQPWNLTHGVPLRKSRHMTYHTTALIPNNKNTMADDLFLGSKHRSYPHTRYWSHRLRIGINICHRAQLRESRHMIYDTTALLPKSCGLMPDGPFRDPKGRFYPHTKYWTHRWRIDMNIRYQI